MSEVTVGGPRLLPGQRVPAGGRPATLTAVLPLGAMIRALAEDLAVAEAVTVADVPRACELCRRYEPDHDPRCLKVLVSVVEAARGGDR